MRATQTERLITWLRQNPGSSSIEITLGLRIVNVTGRVSDIRKLPNLDVECKTIDGIARYWLRENDGTLFGRVA